MSLNRCCSTSISARSSRLAGGSGSNSSRSNNHCSYRKKKSMSFHTAATTASMGVLPLVRISRCSQASIRRTVFTNSTPRVLSTQSNESTASSSGGEVALAGFLALMTSASLMYAFPSSLSSSAPSASTKQNATMAACSPVSNTTANSFDAVIYPLGVHHFDPGGSVDEDDDETEDMPNSRSTPFATMALAAYDQRHAFGSPSTETVGSPKVVAATTLQESKTRDSSRDRPYDVSVRAVKGGRVTMEDEYFVAEGGRFVAVFDGHGGNGVSQFLKHHLYDAVCQHLRDCEGERKGTAKENVAKSSVDSHASNATADKSRRSRIPSVISHATALKAAFAEIEESVLVDEALSYQGSTAVAVCLHECGLGHRTLLSANVGDSRAVLSRHGRAVDLTRDHKPNDERERARILAMGETIEWDRLSQVHRVRNLSLSRAIGDRFAKPVVSGDVEINHFPVMEDADEFIILASDGLWDAMTSEETVAFVHETIENELSSVNIAKDDISNYKLVLRRNMAKFVAREAIRRGSCDNVCVILVWLNDLRQ